MPAPLLFDSCTRACIKNVRDIQDVGDFKYSQIKTILARIKSPEQLHIIETNSPQIRGEDAELWKAFIARDIPKWREKNWFPKNPEKWYEVYCKYKKEQRKEIARDEEILRNTMMGIKQNKDSKISKIVPLNTLPKLPRDPYMMPNNGGAPIKGKGYAKAPPSSLNFTLGSKTKTTTSQGVLMRARREAKEIAQMGKLSTLSSQLSGRRTQITKAPAAMVNEYRTKAQPALKILSKHRSITSSYGGGISGPSLEEREARLRAFTSKQGSYATVGSSEDDNDDDLFDEKSQNSSRPAHSSSPPAARSSGPPRITAPLKPMIQRKRAPIDPFNRGPKRRKV